MTDQEAERVQHRRVEADAAAPESREPADDDDPERDRDDGVLRGRTRHAAIPAGRLRTPSRPHTIIERKTIAAVDATSAVMAATIAL